MRLELLETVSRSLCACARVLGIGILFALIVHTCRAQVDQGAITGVVHDSSGAVIPSARVIVTNLDTGLKLQTQSNSSGVFVLSPLKIGNYSVTANAPGFRSVTQENLHVDAQERLNVNLTLSPGEVRKQSPSVRLRRFCRRRRELSARWSAPAPSTTRR